MKRCLLVLLLISLFCSSTAFGYSANMADDTAEHHFWRLITISSISLIYATNLLNADWAGIEYGRGEHVEFTRGNFRWKFRDKALHADWVNVDILWQGTLLKWQSTIDDSQEQANNVVSTGPVFRVTFPKPWLPFFETSICPAVFSNNKVNDKEFGSHVQFEDTLTMGWRFGKDDKFELAGKFMHFSSNSLSTPNEGINFWLGGLTYKYD